MGLPSFQIIGAPGSGVNTLRDWLRSHPRICLPDPGGEDHYATDLKNRLEDHALYFSRFSRLPKDATVGEWSTRYLYSSDAIPRIVDQAPLTRFIVCLEDPSEIFWRLYRGNLAKGLEKVRDPKSAWALSYARRQGRGLEDNADAKALDYSGMCSLGAQVARLMSRVTSNQILFVFREDLTSTPEKVWNDILAFLDLSDVADPKDLPIQKAPSRHRRGASHRMLDQARKITAVSLRRLHLRDLANSALLLPGEPPLAVRHAISDLLSEDIATLSVLTDRNLMDWVR